MNKFISKFEEAKKYVVNRIKENTYPPGHVFNAESFTENSYIIIIMSFIKWKLVETDLLNDYIDNKLKANDQGNFSIEKYFQGLNELTFFYYLLLGYLHNSNLTQLNFVYYEGYSPYNKAKKLEYQFALDNCSMLNIEVKSITCDPMIKEIDFRLRKGTQYIKKYFHDVDLNHIDDLDDYVVLTDSTHDRQLRKNIKKIVEKFTGNRIQDINMINIGVIVIQFATSFLEFFSYLFNEKKGILKDLEYENLDCLVFFSLTSRPNIDMQDIYDNGHIFTVLLNDQDYIKHYLKIFRLDDIVAYKTKDGIDVIESVKTYAEKEYGIFNLIVDENNNCFFSPIEFDDTQISAYSDYLNGKREYPSFSSTFSAEVDQHSPDKM